MKRAVDHTIIKKLQEQILNLQRTRKASEHTAQLGLGLLENAFAEKVFPRAAIHEFVSLSSQQAACTSGFISVILGKLMQQNGFCVWISTIPRRSIYPPALIGFGISPEKIFFVDAKNEKETLWALEEALKCEALSAVVGELSEMSFNDSRRLQLAVEESRVCGLIHRFKPKAKNALACVSRFTINALPSYLPGKMPGLGFPRWQVDLLKVRNGKPGQWQLQWSPEGLQYLDTKIAAQEITELQTG